MRLVLEDKWGWMKEICNDPLPCGPFMPFTFTIQYYSCYTRYKTLGIPAASVKLTKKQL